MSAARAYEIGLVQRLVADRRSLGREVEVIADAIIECSPLALQAIKEIVHEGRQLPVKGSYELAERIERMIATTEDRLEGPLAFSQSRKPNWKMR